MEETVFTDPRLAAHHPVYFTLLTDSCSHVFVGSRWTSWRRCCCSTPKKKKPSGCWWPSASWCCPTTSTAESSVRRPKTSFTNIYSLPPPAVAAPCSHVTSVLLFCLILPTVLIFGLYNKQGSLPVFVKHRIPPHQGALETMSSFF